MGCRRAPPRATRGAAPLRRLAAGVVKGECKCIRSVGDGLRRKMCKTLCMQGKCRFAIVGVRLSLNFSASTI
jgi:hypothetical protein